MWAQADRRRASARGQSVMRRSAITLVLALAAGRTAAAAACAASAAPSRGAALHATAMHVPTCGDASPAPRITAAPTCIAERVVRGESTRASPMRGGRAAGVGVPAVTALPRAPPRASATAATSTLAAVASTTTTTLVAVSASVAASLRATSAAAIGPAAAAPSLLVAAVASSAPVSAEGSSDRC